MINLIKLQCPNCGANLEIKNDVKQCFCTYCGTKILMSNENEYTYRIIDEARIKEAELNHDLELKRLERQSDALRANLEEKRLDRDIALAQAYGESSIKEREKALKKQRRWKVLLMQIFSFIGIFFLGSIATAMAGSMSVLLVSFIGSIYVAFVYIPKREKEKIMIELGYSRFPKDLGDLSSHGPATIISSLEQAGFSNIVSENLHDLKKGLFSTKSDYVEKVTINGKNPSRGKLYPSDVPVIVIYHGK